MIKFATALLTVQTFQMNSIVRIVRSIISIAESEKCAFPKRKCATATSIVIMAQMKKDAVSYYFNHKSLSISSLFFHLVALAPHMDFASYVHQYYDNGYLVYQEKGESGKVCADYMNKTVPKEEVGRVLEKLGKSMCNMLEYRTLQSIDVVQDTEENEVRYVDMIGPMSKERSFITVPCPSRCVFAF